MYVMIKSIDRRLLEQLKFQLSFCQRLSKFKNYSTTFNSQNVKINISFPLHRRLGLHIWRNHELQDGRFYSNEGTALFLTFWNFRLIEKNKKWTDERLAFDWPNATSIALSPTLLNDIWMPDLFFKNAKNELTHDVLAKSEDFHITSDKYFRSTTARPTNWRTFCIVSNFADFSLSNGLHGMLSSCHSRLFQDLSLRLANLPAWNGVLWLQDRWFDIQLGWNATTDRYFCRY